MAPLRCAAKFDPFLSLDCAPAPSTLAQSKERKGSNFAIWQPWLKDVNNPAIYLHNSEVLFNKYPEIWERMKTAKAEPYLKLKCGYAQLFVGRQGRYSVLSCDIHYSDGALIFGSSGDL